MGLHLTSFMLSVNRQNVEQTSRHLSVKPRSNSHRFSRSHSAARGENFHQQHGDGSARHTDYTMTLPASYSRHKRKQNGINYKYIPVSDNN